MKSRLLGEISYDKEQLFYFYSCVLQLDEQLIMQNVLFLIAQR